MLFDRKTRGSDEYRAGYHAESLDGQELLQLILPDRADSE